MAETPTSELIGILISTEIESHENSVHDTNYSQTEQRGGAAARELDIRVPARPWWVTKK